MAESDESGAGAAAREPAPIARPPWDAYRKRPLFGRPLLLWASVVGFVYGLFVRFSFGLGEGYGEHHVDDRVFGVVTVSFLFGVPLVVGFLVVAIAERDGPISRVLWVVAPWPPALLSLGAALLLGWEGFICIVLWLPLFMVMATLGGVIAGIWRAVRRRRVGAAALAGALLVPFVAAPVERLVPAPDAIRVVESSIDVDARPDAVWRQIVDVPTITEAEHRFSWVHAIGFPRPVAARSFGRGVGSVRHATFEGGVLFVETIDTWQPDEVLSFSIAAQPVPSRTLDEHVTVGGRFFDVLEGTYRIEPLGRHRVRLHLSSRHRLTTRFNAYSGVWTDAIMGEIQRYILRVVARRAEADEARRGDLRPSRHPKRRAVRRAGVDAPAQTSPA
jgi:hypothetical protein